MAPESGWQDCAGSLRERLSREMITAVAVMARTTRRVMITAAVGTAPTIPQGMTTVGPAAMARAADAAVAAVVGAAATANRRSSPG